MARCPRPAPQPVLRRAADPIAASAVYPLGSRVNAAGTSRGGWLRRRRGRPRVRHPRLYLCARRHPQPGTRLRRRPARSRHRVRGSLRQQGRADLGRLPRLPRGGPQRRRRLRRRAPRRDPRRLRARADLHARQQQVRRRASGRLRPWSRLPGRRLARRDRPGRFAPRSRPGRPHPADPRDQAFDPLLRPDGPARFEVRLRDRGRSRRAGRHRRAGSRATSPRRIPRPPRIPDHGARLLPGGHGGDGRLLSSHTSLAS